MTVLPPVSPSVSWADTARQAAFEQWFETMAPQHALDASTLRPASADASFRRYLRVQGGAGSLIIMDAPPPQEDVAPFVHVAGLMQAAGLNAARVLEADARGGDVVGGDAAQRLDGAAHDDEPGRARRRRRQ